MLKIKLLTKEATVSFHSKNLWQIATAKTHGKLAPENFLK